MNLVIRENEEADAVDLREIYYQTRINSFSWLNLDDVNREDFDQDTAGEKIWIAEHSGRVVAFISVWEQENFIHNLFVLPEFTSNGIGTKLLDICMERIGRSARLKCVSANKSALSFYRARGWNTISTGIDKGNEYQLMQAN